MYHGIPALQIHTPDYGRIVYVVGLFITISLLAQDPSYGVPPADAPELAARGPHGVGVRTVDLVNPGQPDILKFDKTTGKAPLYDRHLQVEIWYPATIPAGASDAITYEMAMPRSGGKSRFRIPGKALRDAAPTGAGWPLVIVSHGYPGSRYFMSYLSENLASKGYVVAAIDHTDSVFGAEAAFPSTLYNRTNDQNFVLDAVGKLPFLQGVVDPTRAAVIGYSMGGYGALASAGAGYNPASPIVTALVPGGYMKSLTAGSETFQSTRRKEIRAVVAIAPWGGQPPMNSWNEAGLAEIRIPSLFITGDQDDVSDYARGIKPAFEKAVNSRRCMLVFQNARHNVGGNPAPDAALGSFVTREFFDEPVWRKERLNAINQHFVTAFLDLYVKGDESRRPYLELSSEKSNDGKWVVPQGQSTGGKFSEGSGYWKGFQRRWALGLEMHCAAPSVPAAGGGTR